MAWRFVLTTLTGSVVDLGTIQKAYERRVNIPLNGLPTATVRLDLTDSLAGEIFDLDGDVLLKVYQGSTLHFIGELTTAEEVSQAEQNRPPSVVCNFAGPLWRLQKRVTGKTDFSTTPPTTDLTIPPQDLGDMIADLIEVANSESDTGIRRGTITTTITSDYGPVGYKNLAEAVSEIAAIKAFPLETVASWTMTDSFTRGSGLLQGSSLETGTGPPTWDVKETTTGTTVLSVESVDGGVAAGGGAGDTEHLGSFAVAGTTTFTDVIVQCDIKFTAGPVDLRQGVFARGTFPGGTGAGASWIHAVIESYEGNDTSQITVRLSNAGTVTQLTTAPLPALTATYYRVRLQVQADGQYFVWGFNIGLQQETMLLKGYHAELATGGALATGVTGIYDELRETTGQSRYYDLFGNAVPSGAVSYRGLEYELAPSEPTQDTNQSGVVGSGVKLATLNVAPTLGTDKSSTVIFEFGSGSRTMKSYRRVLDRGLLMNRGYSLPQDFAPGSGGWDVKQSSDLTSMAHPLSGGRGWFEDVVPSDVPSPGLRQALIDEHVRVRGVPREVITFEPTSLGPVFGTDFILGDIVAGRAKVNSSARFNAAFRVYGVEVSIDENGKETISLTLVPDSA